jgi:hypothetical protein
MTQFTKVSAHYLEKIEPVSSSNVARSAVGHGERMRRRRTGDEYVERYHCLAEVPGTVR